MKRSYKISLITVPVLVLAGGVVALNAWSSSPANGTIRTGTPTTASKQNEQAVPLPISTALFNVTLPAGFTQKDASAPNGEVTVRILATNTSTRQQVGISGGTLPREGLTAIADYNLRVKDTGSYIRSTTGPLPSGATAFEDTIGSMITLFWAHGSKYAAITVSGSPGSMRELKELLPKILQNWQWNY